MQQTYKTLFWNIFGYGDVPQDGDIIVDNMFQSNRTNGTLLQNPVIKHKFLEGIGYFLLGFFHIIVIVVLINMLIAMMSNSYNKITVSIYK
jgi:hypothetical protein